jgi:tetratricopeptide (TPR) repeat protein
VRHCRDRLLVVVAAMAALCASPSGQSAGGPDAAYANAVRAYVEGHDVARAVAPLAPLSEQRVEKAVEDYLTQPESLLTAAAVLHLEIGVGVVTLAPAIAAKHLDLGHLLVRKLRERARQEQRPTPADAAAFAERWYVAAASTFLMINDAVRAVPLIGRGLEVAPRSLDLRLMEGIVADLSALSFNPVDAVTETQRIRFEVSRLQELMRAKRTFAQILVDAPSFTRARIRLGRVLWLLNEREAALVELRRAQGEAHEAEQRYLTAMFLGAIYEQKGDVTDARRAYEAALAVAPASQAATVALGYLDVMAGRPDRAQALAHQLWSAPPVADEWWSYKNGGFETVALGWLRSRVWR